MRTPKNSEAVNGAQYAHANDFFLLPLPFILTPMIHRGVATFTLDTGKCPPWLYERMVRLGREIVRVLIEEYGPEEFVRRMGDPVWFQSLGTALAFDWNASGLTTILTAALKEAVRGREADWNVFVCGGKGKTSLKVPDEVASWGDRLSLRESDVRALAYNSRMSAKVDSSLVQDGFQLYHHAFFFSLGDAKNGSEVRAWTVVQQGMNQENQTARRYHWHSEQVHDLVEEPHSGISSQKVLHAALNLTAKKSAPTRDISTELVQAGYAPLMKEVEVLHRHASGLSRMISLDFGGERTTVIELERKEFRHHSVELEDFKNSRYLQKILARVTGVAPRTYEELVSLEGVGPKTVRALALIGELVYGARPSYEDPARYSFAHGGKDATPYPVDRYTYDQSIDILLRVIGRARIDASEKQKMTRRLQGGVSSRTCCAPP
jgi:hypothetical protein